MDEQKRQLAKEDAVKKGIERGMALMREELKMYGMKADGEKIFICEAKDYDSLWEEALKNIEKIPKPEINDKAEEYLNNWKRERADFLNYKKDESRRMEEFVRYANEDLILELIDILDNMELGLKHEPTELLKKLSKDFEELLKKYGVEKIKTEGESFDPVLHEAVESSEVPEARLMEEVRPGYTMHGKVVRPARVKLIK